MADLYAEQGLVDEARDIYEDSLARDPDNASVLERMRRLETMSGAAAPEPEAEAELAPEPAGEEHAAPGNPKIQKLEAWLARVGRKEAGSV